MTGRCRHFSTGRLCWPETSAAAGSIPRLIDGRMGPQLKKLPVGGVPSFRSADKDVSAWVRPANGPLTFRTSGQETDVTLQPFYRLNRQRYSIYWNVS